MAQLLPEQLEFDFFAPPAPEKLKQSENKAKSTAFKDTDILKFQLNKDGSRKLEDFGEDLNNTRKGRSVHKKGDPYQFLTASQDEIEERLATESLDRVWPKEAVFDLHKQNPKAAACLWIVRASLNGRRPPKSSSKYGRYKYIASTAIALHRQVVTGKLAPEAEVEAFDRFYEARDKYEIFSHISPKYWPFISANSIGDAANMCRWNNLELSDGSDINSYRFQCTFPGSMDSEHLCLKNSDGKLYPYYAIAVGNSEKEFEANIEKQLNATFGKLLKAPGQAEKTLESKPKPELPVKLYGRGISKTHTYEVYGKSGSIEFQLTDKIAFESDDAFWKYVNEHRGELEGKYRAFREEFSRSEKDWRSGNPIRDRVGPDYRQGKDATPEMFQETFGFRGVEFGNWVKQGKNGRERQWMLNNAYDSLMDLSKILDIPPKAVALDGGLGLAFGSRGHGAASAHYEVANRVINLTKTKGYSSLAHEWFHALDHYLMRTNYKEIQDPEKRYLSQQVDSSITVQLTEDAKREIFKRAESVYRSAKWIPAQVEYLIKNDSKNFDAAIKCAQGDTDSFSIEVNYQERSNSANKKMMFEFTRKDINVKEVGQNNVIRFPLHDAWAETINAIRDSDMHKRMTRKSDYWHSKAEEAARSFEGFVELRCKEIGITNDFLTNGAYTEKALGKEGFYPYLDGKDVEKVTNGFKRIFKVIKTKETDKGVALFSKANQESLKTPKAEIREALIKAFGKEGLVNLVNNNRFYLAQTEYEALTVASIEQKKKQGFSTIALPQDPTRILGFHDKVNHRTFLIADNLKPETACAVMLHEVGVHMAADSELRAKTRKLIDTAVILYETGLKTEDPLMKTVENRLQESRISRSSFEYREEVCGYLVEEAAKAQARAPAVVRWFNDVKSTVNVWLVEHGVRDTSKLSALDLATIAKANVKEISKKPQEHELSPKGREILAKHVQALSSKYSKLSDAEAEIKGLYKRFTELEQVGKPLPEVPKTTAKEKEAER